VPESPNATVDAIPLCQTPSSNHANGQAGFYDQFQEFWTGMFSVADWPARWYCGNWSDFHGWLYILSDLLIWAAYFAIPLLLVRLVYKKKDLPFPKIIWLFGAFIVLCGTTHLLDAIIFWWPAYRLSALVRLLTAVVSGFTVYVLNQKIPDILSLRSVKELEHEINERRIVEEKLAASEFLLSEAGRVGRVGGWELDVLTDKSTWSKTVYDIFEVPHNHEMESGEFFNFVVDPYRQALKDASLKAQKLGERYDLELLILTARHNKKWVRAQGEPLYDKGNKLIRMRGVFMDIDKYKTNEIALQSSIELMERQNSQLKIFTHILSHNIRNHATNISLLTSIMDKETMDANNQEVLGKMEKVSSNLNATLDDLSTVIQIRENLLPSTMLDFAAVTGNVLAVLDIELAESQTKVKTDFRQHSVSFPEIYLESIIMNLISNGIKYKKEHENAQILLRSYKDEDQNTVLEYSDNGIGINLKLHGNKIFGLYKTFHRHENAHGVGLFLIKNQIESQGGKIEVDSILNEGTKFKITFNGQNRHSWHH